MKTPKSKPPDYAARLGLFSIVLVIFGALRALTATPDDFIGSDASLSSAFLIFVSAHQATYLYVPLFSFFIVRLVVSRLSATYMTRADGRLSGLKTFIAQSLLAALCFSLAVFAPSLVAIVAKSGLLVTAPSLIAFCLLQVVYETLFFEIVALVVLVGFLATKSSVISLLLAVVYGGSDSFISALGAYQGGFWTGWMLMGYADPSNPVLALSGLLRLLALIAVLSFMAFKLMRSLDILESPRHE